MSCLFPISGWRSSSRNENGNYPIVFSISKGDPSRPVSVPCGRCVNCRLNHSSQWAIRSMHEVHYYDYNSFVTLTFDDDHLFNRENPMTVIQRDLQLFMKKLRKRVVMPNPYPKGHHLREWWIQENGIRFYGCGEYGEERLRPHYHILLFNWDFPDKELWQERQGYKLYRSSLLESIWPYGFSTIGDVSLQSAGYVARYCTKKINGDLMDQQDPDGFYHYERINGDTGEIKMVKPEFSVQSRNPGLGRRFYDEFKHDIYRHDRIIMDGKKFLPPKYYDKLYRAEFPNEFSKISRKRVDKAMDRFKNKDDPSSLQKYRVSVTKFKQLVRDLQ